MLYIEDIIADEVFDSRGNPTVRVEVTLSDGSTGEAIVPSGASTGSLEAVELRDGDSRFLGKGVIKSINNVNDIIAEELVGHSPFNQLNIDNILKELDGTNNYSNLGANATLGASMAVAKASSNSLKIPLYRYLGGVNGVTMPTPMLNIINGGSHADNSVDFQEYMIVPKDFSNFSDAIRASAEVYQHLKNILKEEGHSTSLGDEGGFAPNLNSNEEPIDMIIKAIKKAGYTEGKDFYIALDVASSEFYSNGKYKLLSENRELSSTKLIEYYIKLCEKYPICSIEDGLDENDWQGWSELTKALGKKVQLVGDDIFVTNSDILKKAIDKKVANTILIKLNQIGTVSQTMQTIRLAQKHGYKTVISHRSGESEDSFIADLSVAVNAGQIKTGATARGERTAKYNRLLKIERELLYTEFN